MVETLGGLVALVIVEVEGLKLEEGEVLGVPG
jgi:hypothetical protein